MRKIKLMAEYGCFPLWDYTESIPDTPSPHELGLSPELAQQLTAWQRRFDDTLDPHYPPDSGFLTVLALEDFEAAGRALAEARPAELGSGYTVSYESSAGGREDKLPLPATG